MKSNRPGVTLVRRALPTQAARQWHSDAQRLLTHHAPGASSAPRAPADRRGWEPWRVVGGPGTGKSCLVADVAVSRILCSDAEKVLVLTQSKHAATAMRSAITDQLLGAAHAPRATREPLVRTVHSYAFAVLRLQAAAHGNPPPRLLTGSEQDAVIRELLRGEIADGGGGWPERLRPALGVAGFATAVRDLMLRSAERGLGPEDLVKLGRAHKRPEWVAVGQFAARYEQATLLRGAVGVEAPEATAPGLDAAELIAAALMAFATDPELLRSERTRIRHLLVDDAQHLDPQAAQLIRLIGTNSDTTVIAGDPDQAAYTFRGADPTFLTELPVADSERSVLLHQNFRSGSAVVDTLSAIATKLPGGGIARGASSAPADRENEGSVRVEVLSSTAKEATTVAAMLRRAHLVDGIEWHKMAVIVRSVPRTLAPIRRALTSAGVPMVTPTSDLPLHRQHGATGFLLVLRAISDPSFSGIDAIALVAGPIGGADPIALRRLRRGLRRHELLTGGERDSAELLRLVLHHRGDTYFSGFLAGLSDVEAAPLRRVLHVLRKADAAWSKNRGVEEVLWASWQASGLERKWSTASFRGGALGAGADRSLDSVVALFDAAADYVDKLPRARVSGFVDYLTQQEIPRGSRSASQIPADAVTVTSAHSSAGREWDVVAVAGVQEGLWPGLRSRGGLLDTEAFVDLAAGHTEDGRMIDGILSKTAPLLAEERRLFLVACSRARQHLLVTAVDSNSGDEDLVRSRFVDELLARATQSEPEPLDEVVHSRMLALPALVAELRNVVCDPHAFESDPARALRAATQLARLARAGVRGAHPGEWFGLAGPSSDTALWNTSDGPVALSPSSIELIGKCPLRWMLARHGGTDGDNVSAITGTLVHTLVQAVAGRIPATLVRVALENAWDAVDLGSQWYSRHELGRTAAMLESFDTWLRNSRGELTEIGVEVRVDGILPARGADEPAVHLRGRIDRLERDLQGRPVIIDVKTARTPVTQNDAQEHAQLAAYQVAAAHGLIEGEAAGPAGGGRLVFVAKAHKRDGAAQRQQAPLDAERLDQWRDVIHRAAAATQGPAFEAKINDGCRHCPIKPSCPAQETGRQVTDI